MCLNGCFVASVCSIPSTKQIRIGFLSPPCPPQNHSPFPWIGGPPHGLFPTWLSGRVSTGLPKQLGYLAMAAAGVWLRQALEVVVVVVIFTESFFAGNAPSSLIQFPLLSMWLPCGTFRCLRLWSYFPKLQFLLIRFLHRPLGDQVTTSFTQSVDICLFLNNEGWSCECSDLTPLKWVSWGIPPVRIRVVICKYITWFY